MLSFSSQAIFNKIFSWNSSEALSILWIYLFPFIFICIVIFIVFVIIKSKSEQIEKDDTVFIQEKTIQTQQNKKILVVDDSLVVRKKLLKLFGDKYEILSASNGQEALDILDKNTVSVLITDLQMPIMDGFELIDMVKGDLKTENLPIIAITAHEELTAKVHTIQGIYGIFNKPWNDRELIKRVETLSNIS